MTLIKWHGHACVEIRRGDGYTIVVDPHDGRSLGIKTPEARADLILVTHDHFDHNAVDVVAKPGSKTIIMGYGTREVDGVTVTGLRTFHDPRGGTLRGVNMAYVIAVEGARIAHLGDIGAPPPAEAVEQLRGVDLLILPVGGVYTIGPTEAWGLVEDLKPRNVMPIHYRIPGLRLGISPVDNFLSLVRGYEVRRLGESSFKLEEFDGAVVVPAPP